MNNSFSFIGLVIIAFFISFGKPKQELYLIPYGYRGKVNVVFNQSKGAPVKYEKEKRVYKIPINGILLISSKMEVGIVERKFYTVDSLGRRSFLKTFNDDNFHGDKAEVGVFYDGTVGVYGNSDNEEPLDYQEFVVSSYEGLDVFFKPEYKLAFQDELIRTIGRRF